MNTEALVRDVRARLSEGGLRACLLVRDLGTGEEVGIDPDTDLPSASLVKVPLALATLERIRRGELDGATPLDVAPGRVTTPGPTGLSRFRHPARIAIDDLLYLSTCLSDGTAADALFDLTPPARVAGLLREAGLRGITVRHRTEELFDTPMERFDADQAHLAHALAIDAGTSGRGHRVPQLDTTRANTGSARSFVDLLQALWTPSKIHPDVAERLRDLLAHNVLRHRLTPDFSSDASRWSSKTGTLLNLRHEIGVVEHADGQAFAIAVLTESSVPAGAQPGVDALMAEAARRLRDHLRQL
ncbi:class A beta-lactamase-related serine hydrolase [Streptomyces filamentosus]|uniref:Class A beta-lactamase-related serine hydrolase n=2 Tax=Streptomyces filamentosus TaxID=67294 RepID=A0ABY4UNP2_STRFL|nr:MULTISPECIES: serine hydrolase [Streptomyces]EFE79325.1 regulatory protein for beta-lactamase [Streptomyces filamentosus NRRL 15998]ESU46536.1 beta-lactamase [Streptomyces sp. HCCB10043]EWS96155.1 regulatory protein for beta-lactamase [Streptomyces filamentosus NRRL 11379]MYR83147.1 serine hydrolase [Streptomyces sp. SID5466]USC45429.1 class A beta-lactamase-related serine hydrolase [Streptomyces filamentosus]